MSREAAHRLSACGAQAPASTWPRTTLPGADARERIRLSDGRSARARCRATRAGWSCNSR
eukprot:9503980-Pyramimonas_sp.AAC.2